MKKLLSILLTLIITLSIFVMPIKSYGATLTSQAGIVSVSSGKLNVRKSASTSSAILTSLTKGSYVTLISQSGNWYYVEYADDKYGYCHKDYIKLDSGKTATVKTQSTSLNVRSGAGAGYAIKDTIPKGEIVIILSTSNGWSKILYNGTKTGFVSDAYLSINSTDSTYSKVSLKVPSYKQTDSRWSDVKIGTSGKTIGQIGCVTTAIAMIESYRTGTTIYPDAMSKKLSYSSTGNVYWPGDYIAVTSSSGYLSKIYEKLKEGKPVLFGAKKSTGTQHWVVIIGYNGNDTLTASGFTINDPGSKSRTTLQHLLNEYPTFYKYFYY
ncbi:MAG: SH3 domain-containing protein [Clostridia bacterium]|nr:SH3 domain-containing protein [Clostridia bacterium]